MTVAAFAQDTLPHRYAITAGYHRGFLIAHRPLVVPLQQDKINGFECSIIMQPDGSKEWHHVYGFPEAGLSIALWDLGNPEQLGKSIAVIPYLDFPLTKGKNISFDLKFGWGLGYIQKTFDSDDNYKNVAIGSRMNYALILQPHVKTSLSDHLTLSSGISLTHYSNGSITTPNLGLNIASLTAGLTWKFGKSVPLVAKELPPFNKSRRFTFYGAIGSKQIYPAEGRNYLAFSLSANQSWQVSRKSAFGFGADVFHDQSIHRKLKDKGQELNNDAETIRGGLHASYELVVADISFILNMGGYLYSKVNDGLFYHRIGLKYKISEPLFAVMNIKAHWGKADYIEWGLGYRLGKR